MGDLDLVMIDVLRRGEIPSAAHFGGVESMLSSADDVGRSAFADEFVKAVLPLLDEQPERVGNFVATIVESVRDDIQLNHIIDALAAGGIPHEPARNRMFRNWRRLAADRSLPASARSAALKGALLSAQGDERRMAIMVADVADTDTMDDPDYISHAARIGGCLHARASQPAIVQFLTSAKDVVGASDQAHFELGMVHLGEAIEAGGLGEVRGKLRSAALNFRRSIELDETRHDARVFETAIDLLDSFYERNVSDDVDRRINELKRDTFAYSHYVHTHADWLDGAKATLVAAFSSLGIRLNTLWQSLRQSAWLHAARVIEDELVVAYAANRTLLAGSAGRGVDALIRPTIQTSLFAHHAQLEAVKVWLEKTGRESDPGAIDPSLLTEVEKLFLEVQPPDPAEAATARPSVVALLARAQILPGREELELALQATSEAERNKCSPEIMKCLAAASEAFGHLEDYRNEEARAYYLAIAFKSMLFVEHRLDATASQDPSGAYLFEPTALEGQLQQDYLRFLRTSKLGAVDELRGVGGGRADVVVEIGRYRFVTEIKRELQDASLENLVAAYGSQASVYQATNVRLGFLLALDLSAAAGSEFQLSSLCRPYAGIVAPGQIERGIFVMKLPGNRKTPSELTVEAKRRLAGAERGGKGRR